MKFKVDEISSVLREEISKYQSTIDVAEVGKVLEVGDGIARLYGLSNAMAGEMVEFADGAIGQVLNLEEGSVGVAILGDYLGIKEGDEVKRTGKLLSVPCGPAMIGRVVDPLGRPLDGKGDINSGKSRPAEFKAPGVVARQPVREPLQTGIKSIDGMIPVGRGQRELIIGDRQTGKTSVTIDSIINNKDSGVISVYVAIGQRMSTIVQVREVLEAAGAMENTIIVAAPADEAAPIKFIAPYAGTAMAEYFLYKGGHALCIYDDLTKHAYAYRQMSLLLRRPPGREAYPGDVFYLHSRLLERAVKLSDAEGGGSLTSLPIIETQANDVSAYIPTNVISITDGQIFLESDLFAAGLRPAINAGLSVSRVGGSAQTKIIKKLGGGVRLALAQYRELAAFSQFASDLDEATRKQLERGQRVTELMKQSQYSPLTIGEMAISLFAANEGYLDDVPVTKVVAFESALHGYVAASHGELMDKVNSTGDWNDELEAAFHAALKAFKETGSW